MCNYTSFDDILNCNWRSEGVKTHITHSTFCSTAVNAVVYARIVTWIPVMCILRRALRLLSSLLQLQYVILQYIRQRKSGKRAYPLRKGVGSSHSSQGQHFCQPWCRGSFIIIVWLAARTGFRLLKLAFVQNKGFVVTDLGHHDALLSLSKHKTCSASLYCIQCRKCAQNGEVWQPHHYVSVLSITYQTLPLIQLLGFCTLWVRSVFPAFLKHMLSPSSDSNT
jgi:hypothetical protein